MSRRVALVAGGGTAGHVLPALAVARALEADYGPGSVEVVGARRGLEADVLPSSGLAYTLLPGRGIARRLDPRTLVQNAAAVAGLAAAVVRAVAVVARAGPRVVVAVGGYASVPAALVAAAARVPVVVVNTDAVPGAANRLLGRLAAAAAVAHPGTELPRAVVTGAPVRAEVLAARGLGRAPARQALGLDGDGSMVAVVGGSLGARRLNEAAVALAARWAERAGTTLYHVVGRRDAAWAAEHAAAVAPGGLAYVQVPYEDRLPLVYAAADVVVARAGAMTVAELAVLGRPSVLVPLPGAPGDHQTANARVLERAGAALVVPDAECRGETLDRLLGPLLADPDRLAAMGRAAAAAGRPDAAAAVAAVAEAHARPAREVRR